MAKEIKGTAQSQEALLEFVKSTSDTFDLPYPVDIKITEHTGLLDCYAVFWIWMRHLTEKWKERWPNVYYGLDKEGEVMHDIVCKVFLGETKARKVGKTLIEPRQKTLTSPRMGKGELVDFLRRIEEWSIEMGIPLPQPPSEYNSE